MSIQLQSPERLVIYVTDMTRSTAFYRDTLGLPLKFSSPGWTEFNNVGTIIALHRRMAGDTSTFSGTAGQATLVFVVDNLQEVYETLKAEDVHFSLEPQKQQSGVTLAVLHDPDGFSITLQQRAASREEQ